MDILIGSSSSVDNFNNSLSPEDIEILSRAKNVLSLIQQTSGLSRLRAIHSLIALSENGDNIQLLCLDEDLSLLSSIKELLRTTAADDNHCIHKLLTCLNYLSSVKCGGLATGSKHLALLPLLMKIVQETPDRRNKIIIELIMSNCSIHCDCHDYLLSPEVEWLTYLENGLTQSPNNYPNNLFIWLANFLSDMKETNIHLLISRDIPGMVLRKILSYETSYESHSSPEMIRVIMNFSQFPCGSCYLKECFDRCLEFSSFFFDLLSNSSSSTIGIYCTIILANIYGREGEKNGKTKPFLSSHPSILSSLVAMLDAIMNWDVKRPEIKELIKFGYLYGLINFSNVSAALRNLSISDENKRIMIQDSKLMSFIYQGITLFINNSLECKGMNLDDNWPNSAGGGGKDFVTIENLLELCLQLSFPVDDDDVEIFQSTFIMSPYNLKEMMEVLLNLPKERNVTCVARQFAQQLLLNGTQLNIRSGRSTSSTEV
jgi:hypothetical protein